MNGMNYLVPLIWCVLTLSLRAEWKELFNGTDFEGWGGAGKTEWNGYVAKEGVLESTSGCSILATEKEYADYVLEFEFQVTPGANNGLGIHYPGEGDPAYTGMELQILDNSAQKYKNLKEYQFHGSLYTLQGAERGYLKPAGEWNVQRVTVRGERVSVELNGVCILDADLGELEKKYPKHEGVKRRTGKVAFCGHGDVVRWRNIRIAELAFGEDRDEAWYFPKGKKDLSLAELGFVSLFDGQSLSGWKQDAGHEGHWVPKEGWILFYDGKSEAKDKHLWTEKSYRDFTLVCDWRWGKAEGARPKPVVLPNGMVKKDGEKKPVKVEVPEFDSGIYLRGAGRTQVNLWTWTVGSGEVYGIRNDGKVPLPVRAALTPRVVADRAIGEWNRFVIEMRGERVTVFLNGKRVLHEALLPGVRGEGPFALQHHGTEVEFANIYVKEQ